MQRHGTVGFVAMLAAGAAVALSACSAAPEEATGSTHDALRGRVPVCSQEPTTDCVSACDYLSGYVVLTADETCPRFMVGRTIFTGYSGRQFLADIADTPAGYQARYIPRLTPDMESGVQPFCIYRPADLILADALAPYESSFCSLSMTVDVFCTVADPDGKPGCAKCQQ